MATKLQILQTEGRYNAQYIDEILDAVSLTADDELPMPSLLRFQLMQKLHCLGLFAVPCWDWVEKFAQLVKGKRVLDFGAGTGIITAMLRRLGVASVAVDIDEWKMPRLIDDLIVADGLEYLSIYKGMFDVLFVGWPPMNETCKMACDLFFDEGKEIFYLGEDRNGCTADRSFFDAYSLEQIDVGYRPLFGVYDQMFRVCWKRGEAVEEVREKELEVV